MLRPALLLPSQSFALDRLLTPRCGRRPLDRDRLGPATRRSGAYRDGTLTRWKCAVRDEAIQPGKGQLLRLFTTRHAAKVASSPRPGQAILAP